jgi:hypothetical protein
MAGERPALHPLTSDERGPLVIVIAYSLASIATLAAITRFSLAYTRKVSFGLDDATFLVANVSFPFCSLANTLLTSIDRAWLSSVLYFCTWPSMLVSENHSPQSARGMWIVSSRYAFLHYLQYFVNLFLSF